MTKFATLLAAALIAPAAIVAAPAAAQVNGIAVADPQGAVAGTRAWAAARTQIQGTYKAQLDQADARSRAIQAELQPLVTQFQNAQRAPGATNTSLAPQYQAIQAKQQAGQAEIARITAPAERAQAYAVEQIQARLGEAVQNVVKQRNVSLLVSPQAVLFLQPNADITAAITTELDRLVPSVNTNVPANWQPGQQTPTAGGTVPARTPAPAATTPARPRSGGR
jgi:Skp family chaperone for outer membrane proteins